MANAVTEHVAAPETPLAPRSILLFAFGDLGDAVLTVPGVRAIRERYPEARLTVVGKEVGAQFFRKLGLVDDAVVVDKHAFDRAGSILSPARWLSAARLVLRLRRSHPDTVVVFHHLVTRWGALKYAVLSLASGAERRVGLGNGRGWFLSESLPDKGFGERHEAQYWLDVAGLLGARGDLALTAPIGPDDVTEAENLLGGVAREGVRLVAIHPGTGWYGPGRRWPAARFAQTANLLSAETPLTFILVGTDQEAAEIAEVKASLVGRALDLGGRTSVGTLAAVLKRCELLIANDGGVAHLSAAAGTPVVSIFGPSNDRAWRPLLGAVVSSEIPCRPCFYRDQDRGLPNGCSTRECLAQVTPSMVARAASCILESKVDG